MQNNHPYFVSFFCSIGPWNRRKIDASQAERLGRSRLYCSALSLARSAQAKVIHQNGDVGIFGERKDDGTEQQRMRSAHPQENVGSHIHEGFRSVHLPTNALPTTSRALLSRNTSNKDKKPLHQQPQPSARLTLHTYVISTCNAFANTVEDIEVDFAPSNVTPDQKVSVETQTNINNRTVAVQVNSRPKYRSVSVQCKISSIGVNKSCSPIKTGSISTATSPIKPLRQKSFSSLLEDAQKSLSSNSYTHSNSSQDIYEPSENTGSSAMDSSSFQSPKNLRF
ncbi:hypothetical protein EVAR_50664_1 [Eumeta japonica]|uniref:Uncharacterized protein n=1 Tax=Eumeta variegata TaxID=151549 RepID=A0A4C1XPB4_EUMVA|nr:hypothetical protein EVAR_50664_1 [Eumeta japonica]